MEPICKVTEEEMNAIRQHINNNAETFCNVSTEYILREWNEKKQDLFTRLFNEESLILTKKASFTKNWKQIYAELDSCWDGMGPEAKSLYKDFLQLCEDQRAEIWGGNIRRRMNYDFETPEQEREYVSNCKKEEEWYACERILDCDALAKNEVLREFTIPLPKPDGSTRPYKVQKGSKPMRILGRIMRAYNLGTDEGYKDFCTWHSHYLNDKELVGEMCLSIHPFDYMTMSENLCDWSSCMNWEESGCYRSGTVEMMNSPMVVVAYLKSKTDMSFSCGWNPELHQQEMITWNSKKWRILLLVNEYGIFSVKGYPYQHKGMTRFCMEWIASLLSKNSYEPVQKFTPYEYTTFDPNPLTRNIKVRFNPSTFRMYNDYGSTTHYVMLDHNWAESIRARTDVHEDVYFCYSGASECMSCGALSYRDESNEVYFDSEEALTCYDCNPNVEKWECESCGRVLTNEDDVYWVADLAICPDCFARYYFADAFTDEHYAKIEGIHLFVKETGTGKLIDVGLVSRDNLYEWVDKEDFEIDDELKEITIEESDFTDRGNRLFNSFKLYFRTYSATF